MMNDQSSRWLMQARHDLESARKNQAIELYDVALVLCQQAIVAVEREIEMLASSSVDEVESTEVADDDAK